MHSKRSIRKRRNRLADRHNEPTTRMPKSSNQERDAPPERGQKRLSQKTLGHVGVQRLDGRSVTVWPSGR